MKSPPSRQRSPQPSALSPESALVTFAKAPIPGQVKTRLCPPLTADEAASLHGSFVLDAVERAREAAKAFRHPVDRYVACAPSMDHVFFKILEERQGLRLLPQLGGDLGARMAEAIRTLCERGYRRVVITGSDLPSLPASCLTEAVARLADHDLVLGPSLDGGYYLVGMTRPAPELFADLPWSTDQVLAVTRRKADALGLRTCLLPPWRDIDTIDDLYALIDEFGLRPAPAPRASLDRARGREHVERSRLAPRTGLLTKRTEGALRLLASRLPLRPIPEKT